MKFGDLILLERLAAGGMAEVFRAKQLGYAGFEKYVAVKRVLPHIARDKRFKNLFAHEAHLTANLGHPNIGQVYKNGECDGYLYLVMEFIDGKTVRELLGKADELRVRIPVQVSCFIMLEVLKGLEFAHNRINERNGDPLNIVHRDVSPQNIMMAYQGSVKIVDFGIAKAASSTEATREGAIRGKFGYMSPEQARGEVIDKRSDIFSMGIVFWELLTQQRLFTYDDDLVTLEKVKECDIPRPTTLLPSLPATLERIVMRALRKDAADRYETCQEFYTDLARYMSAKHSEFFPHEFSAFLTEFFRDEMVHERALREEFLKGMFKPIGHEEKI